MLACDANWWVSSPPCLRALLRSSVRRLGLDFSCQEISLGIKPQSPTVNVMHRESWSC